MYRLSDAFPYLVARVGVRMAALFSRRLERYRMTLPMYRVMAALWQQDGQRLGQLSEMTSLEISTLSRLIGTMQRKGLVSRVRPNSNGRTVTISLTGRGRTQVEQLIPLAQRHEDVGLMGFAASEVEVLKKQLATVYRNLDVLEAELAEASRGVGKKRSPGAPGKADRKPAEGRANARD